MTQVHPQNNIEVATIENNDNTVTIVRQTRVELGRIRENTISAFIRNTYPARYNHIVQNMNDLIYDPNEKKKWPMRGGHFFLYRYVTSASMLLSLCFGITSIFIKPFCAIPFIITIIYITLSIINIVIYFKNIPLIKSVVTMQVPNGTLGGWMNKFYLIPVNAEITTGIIANYADQSTIAAALQSHNIQITEIDVMLYEKEYLDECGFPKEILVHLKSFIILFVLTIIFYKMDLWK